MKEIAKGMPRGKDKYFWPLEAQSKKAETEAQLNLYFGFYTRRLSNQAPSAKYYLRLIMVCVTWSAVSMVFALA